MKKKSGSRLGFAQPNFHPNWAGLAVLFSRQILNGSQNYFFHFNILILIYCFKYETIETHARAFLTLNTLSIGTVNNHQNFEPSLIPKYTLPIPKIISAKNARAWVSMVSYLKK